MTLSAPAARAAAPLFTPFSSAKFSLPNRVVMAPMTRSFATGGVPAAAAPGYYARRARADVGLVISEATLVGRPSAGNEPDVPRFWGDDALTAWQPVVSAVNATGSAFWPQLWHVGAVRNPMVKWTPPAPPESPSGVVKPGRDYGVAMTEADIEATITAFAQAAAQAKRLGAGGVELHGAHGYLIDQFFWAGTNQRTDRWGASRLLNAAALRSTRSAQCAPQWVSRFPCAFACRSGSSRISPPGLPQRPMKCSPGFGR